MKAILVNDDRSLRWDEVDDPVIKPDEVLVEIHAAALNRADLLQRQGKYPSPPGCPEWMGLEIAGTVVHLLGGILGLVMMAILAVLNAAYLLTPVNVLVYGLVWMIPGLLITEWTRTV